MFENCSVGGRVLAASQPKPEWIKVKAPGGQGYLTIKELLGGLSLTTVCQEARCPNIGECWEGGTATFMLLGEVCTRGCRFCAVKTGNPKGRIDMDEPDKVGFAISQMKLKYVVLTSVDRDDLEDEGAGHFARTVEVIKSKAPDTIVEVLTPDFHAHPELVNKIVQAKPNVFGHNVETVERLQRPVRDSRAGYQQSLNVLRMAKEMGPSSYTKSSLMLGLGEEAAELRQTLCDLQAVGCDVVTFGQYLQPQSHHLKVQRFYTPQEFEYWQKLAEDMGFLYVASGPLVRSSYRAGEFFMKSMIEGQGPDHASKNESRN